MTQHLHRQDFAGQLKDELFERDAVPRNLACIAGQPVTSVLGAQISNIRIIKEAMREASFLYAELLALGAAMTTVDVGGGLAVDYEAPTSPPLSPPRAGARAHPAAKIWHGIKQ